MAKGSSDVVYRGRRSASRHAIADVAVKEIDKATYLRSRRTCTTTRREVRILEILAAQAHPHIVSFVGACETAESVQIVTEFLAGGTL